MLVALVPLAIGLGTDHPMGPCAPDGADAAGRNELTRKNGAPLVTEERARDELLARLSEPGSKLPRDQPADVRMGPDAKLGASVVHRFIMSRVRWRDAS